VTLDFIQEDIRKRIDLALSWLYEEHSLMQGFNRCPSVLKQEVKPDENYNRLLCTLIKHVVTRCKFDVKDREVLLHRLYLETPLISEEAMDLLRDMCADEAQSGIGLRLLQELVVRKPPRQMHYLNALLVHTAHESNIVSIV
jgi:symplekin